MLYLTHKELWLVFCLFLKFEYGILVIVLMLNFGTSCTNRPFHIEYENVICAKKTIHRKMVIKNF